MTFDPRLAPAARFALADPDAPIAEGWLRRASDISRPDIVPEEVWKAVLAEVGGDLIVAYVEPLGLGGNGMAYRLVPSTAAITAIRAALGRALG